MFVRDLFDALRGRPSLGGDGRCRTKAGALLELELFKFDGCPYCQRVFRAVERLGVPVRHRDVLADDAAADRLLEIGGKDQVPCLLIDGEPLYESKEIVAFLERHFG